MDVQLRNAGELSEQYRDVEDVDEGGKTVSITDSTVATYAFDDEPTLTAKVIKPIP